MSKVIIIIFFFKAWEIALIFIYLVVYFSTAIQTLVHGYMSGYNKCFGYISVTLQHMYNGDFSSSPWSSGSMTVNALY